MLVREVLYAIEEYDSWQNQCSWIRDSNLTHYQSLSLGTVETDGKILSISPEIKSYFESLLVFHTFYLCLWCQQSPFSDWLLLCSFTITSRSSWKEMFLWKEPWIQPVVAAEEWIPSTYRQFSHLMRPSMGCAVRWAA